MVELKIRSCFPKGQQIDDQYLKVREEEKELIQAICEENKLETIKEALDGAVASIGLAELVAEKLIEEKGFHFNAQELLQKLIKQKYKKKQQDFRKEQDFRKGGING